MVDLPAEDLFSKAALQLERIAELKQKNLVNETEYQELRSQLINQLRYTVSLSSEKTEEPPLPNEGAQPNALPYGQLHLQIVRKLSANYMNADEDRKKHMRKSINEMAEVGALYPGDSADIEAIIEIVADPFFESTAKGPARTSREVVLDKVLSSLTSLSNVHIKIINKPNPSPAAKAIAEVTYQSAEEAAKKIGLHKQNSPQSLWRRLVLPDLEGALEGGAAAVTIAPAFIPFFPLSLPIAAAFGAVVGGGIRSGIASAEVGKQEIESGRFSSFPSQGLSRKKGSAIK